MCLNWWHVYRYVLSMCWYHFYHRDHNNELFLVPFPVCNHNFMTITDDMTNRCYDPAPKKCNVHAVWVNFIGIASSFNPCTEFIHIYICIKVHILGSRWYIILTLLKCYKLTAYLLFALTLFISKHITVSFVTIIFAHLWSPRLENYLSIKIDGDLGMDE